jgi:hypothetical protein
MKLSVTIKWGFLLLLTGAVALAIPASDPYSGVIHTATNQLIVSSNSRVGEQMHFGTAGFSYYGENIDYLFDGSLILGNSADNLSWSIYSGLGWGEPTPSNPYGYLQSLSPIIIDSTSSSSYMTATGTGANRDSTLGFRVTYYAPKQADSSDFYIAYVKIYKGLNDPTGSVTGLTVAYAAGWSFPVPWGFVGFGGVDASLQLLYEREVGNPTPHVFTGLTAIRKDYTPIVGGFVWDNIESGVTFVNFENDTLWDTLQATSGFSSTDSLSWLSSILVIAKNATINGATHDTLGFSVIFLAQNNGTLQGLKNQVGKARMFNCLHVNFNPNVCTICHCGDCNSDGKVNITDPVFLLAYIFSGGPRPNPPCNADANGDHKISVSDAVFIVNYIFAGGTAPYGCTPIP